MDNIIMDRIWTDETELFFEVSVEANSKFVRIYQTCYLSKENLFPIRDKIQMYIDDPTKNVFIEFGSIIGNYTPSFSMELFPMKIDGSVVIELDMEVNDNDRRLHRCKFYVISYWENIRKFGKNIMKLSDNQYFESVKLN